MALGMSERRVAAVTILSSQMRFAASLRAWLGEHWSGKDFANDGFTQ